MKKEIKIYDKIWICIFGYKLFSINNMYVGKLKYDEKDDKFRFYLRYYPNMSSLNQEIIQKLNHLLEEYGEELK